MKKEQLFNVVIYGAIALFSILGLALAALPALDWIGFSSASIWECAFGNSDGLDAHVGLIFALLLGFVLPLAIATLELLKEFKVMKFEINPLFVGCAIALLSLVAFILFLCTESIVTEGNTSSNIDLAGGAICAIIFSALNLLLGGAIIALKFTKK